MVSPGCGGQGWSQHFLYLGPEPLVVLHLTRGYELGNLFRDGLSDARDFLEVLAVSDHLLQLRWRFVDGPCHSLVCYNGKPLFSLHL